MERAKIMQRQRSLRKKPISCRLIANKEQRKTCELLAVYLCWECESEQAVIKVLKIYLVDLLEMSECSLSNADSSKTLLFSVPPLVAKKSRPSSSIFDFSIRLFCLSFHSVFCRTVTNHAARYSSF